MRDLSLPTMKTNIPAKPGHGGWHHKKLRRLPHLFSNTLELPLQRDTDVVVHSGLTSLWFTVAMKEGWKEIQAHPIEILPSMTKLVIRDCEGGDPKAGCADIKVDRWRCRLLDSARPCLATARVIDRELILTVPLGTDGSD
ncbi:uncharacterized protein LOC120284131 [Dioscorea cayenensis subsp. rotundata]|uniref:Uncharacterized protein LOC120284131 n=1 Tax=Dioscorea cayennensis subsp. rotundata TaxID=55577 RepID=A0AB40D3I8_DIOCR|nr:uncharacterized protein LOC120284131 [Dioscorea cayenensis subsp. rotundata]